jgi:hypothetical protein
MENYWKVTDEDIRTVLFRYFRGPFGKRAITRVRAALDEEKVALAAQGECGDIAQKLRVGYDEIECQLGKAKVRPGRTPSGSWSAKPTPAPISSPRRRPGT